MASLLPLLPLFPLLLLLPSKTSIPQYYTSLRHAPQRLPSSATILARLRYTIHKAYFQYLITFSAYMLSTFERLLLDVFMAVLVGVVVWFFMFLAPVVWGVVRLGLLGASEEVGRWMRDGAGGAVGKVGVEEVGNMTVVVETVFGMTASVVRNGTCTAAGV
ncbi:hypothetical protein P280DRAFT_39069 [Massarina eburnea CBS 473.64]|uniref:ABC transmembrane type-1 domain-containing protein n=1 Tax=Massarina eburnea CBS 473.64 TaxID=1395130 RepID=A0A6A6RWX0_9PLEO|nr:hypothetical protein P280DRAFT_39069 [Massarina eburnea CBS 473.64]